MKFNFLRKFTVSASFFFTAARLVMKIIIQKVSDISEKGKRTRVVYLNNQQPKEYYGEPPLKYSGNEIKTSKVCLTHDN